MQTEDVITLKCGRSVAKVHLFGATIVSWEVEDQELLFLSKQSLFDNKKAIRGGIPFVFPQFGPWTVGPQHGFARISKWSLSDTNQNNNEKATFILEENEATRALWNHRFKIEYTVTLKEKQMLMDVNIQNQGEEEFSFTLLLHTYFSVPDILQCEVTGLKGCSYIDKVKDGSLFKETKGRVKVTEFTDRIYKSTSSEQTLVNVAGSRSIGIKKTNFPDTVLWNPWAENAKSMSDFGDEEWCKMICVEAGRVAEPAVLAPQQNFHAAQILSLIDSARL